MFSAPCFKYLLNPLWVVVLILSSYCLSIHASGIQPPNQAFWGSQIPLEPEEPIMRVEVSLDCLDTPLILGFPESATGIEPQNVNMEWIHRWFNANKLNSLHLQLIINEIHRRSTAEGYDNELYHWLWRVLCRFLTYYTSYVLAFNGIDFSSDDEDDDASTDDSLPDSNPSSPEPTVSSETENSTETGAAVLYPAQGTHDKFALMLVLSVTLGNFYPANDQCKPTSLQ